MQVNTVPPSYVRVIQRARAWIWGWQMLALILRSSVIGAGMALATVIVCKLALAQSSVWIAPLVGVGSLVLALLWTMSRHPRLTVPQAAQKLDEALGTRETFLTALGFRVGCFDGSRAFGQLVESRANKLAERAPVSKLGRPALGPTLGLGLLLIITAGLLDRFAPYFDGLGGGKLHQLLQQQRLVLESEARKLDQVAKQLKSPLTPMQAKDPVSSGTAAAAEALEALRRSLTDQRQVTDSREALAKLSSVTDQMEKRRQEAQQQGQVGVDRETSDSLAGARARVTARFERALRRGNMEQAKDELSRLEQQATDSSRSADDRQALGQQLKALSERIQGQQGLSAALGKMGSASSAGDQQGGHQAASEARGELERIAAAQAEARQLAQALDSLQGTRENLAEANQAGQSSSDGRRLTDANSPSQGGQDTDSQSGAVNGKEGTAGTSVSPNESAGSDFPGSAGSPSGGQSSSENQGSPAGQDGSQASGSEQPSMSAGEVGSQGQENGSSGSQSGQSPEADGSRGSSPEVAGSPSGTSNDSGGPGTGQFEIGSGPSPSASEASQNSSGSEAPDSGNMSENASGESGQGQPEGESKPGGEQSQSGGSQSGGFQSGGSQSGASGSGNPSSGWGVGTTNLDAGRGTVGAPRLGENRQVDGRRSNWTEDFIRLYDPRANATQGQTERAGARLGEGKFTGSLEVRGSPRDEKARTETARAFLDWRETNRNSQAGESIPRGYRDFVKGYFDSIDPLHPSK
jgi:hypothetical protein